MSISSLKLEYYILYINIYNLLESPINWRTIYEQIRWLQRYIENKNKALLKCKGVLLTTAQGHSTIHTKALFLVFIRDLFLTPWNLGTKSPRFKAMRLGYMTTWRDSIWEPGHQDYKETSWDDQPMGDGKEETRTAPPTAISTGIGRHVSLLWIFVVVFLSYILTGRKLLAEMV